MSTLSPITISRSCAALGLGLHRKTQLHSYTVLLREHSTPSWSSGSGDTTVGANYGYNLSEAIALTLPGPLARCWRCNGVQKAQEGKIPSRPRSMRSALSQAIFGQNQSKCEVIAVYKAFSTILHHHSPYAVSQLLSSEPIPSYAVVITFLLCIACFLRHSLCPASGLCLQHNSRQSHSTHFQSRSFATLFKFSIYIFTTHYF